MSKQVNSNSTKLVRIDAHWLYYAKLEGVRQGRTVKSLVEEGLGLVLNDIPQTDYPLSKKEVG
ncbi:MAG: hypothetical protein ACD_40C00179G0006 [uncultured bacterium]|nr:MAG: hypothetical protein ACD_40C00179G0006 [uncultured bacterium]